MTVQGRFLYICSKEGFCTFAGMKNKPQTLKKSFLFTLFLLALLPCPAQEQKDVLNHQVNKLGQALFYIQQYYLDSLDTSGAVDEMISTLAGQLDPHSSYIPEAEVRSMTEPLEGNFEGIGIEFAIIRDTLVVMTPVAGAPSEAVGIRADDRIVAVDGEAISSPELTNQKVFSLLRGPKGTRVSLTVIRRGEREPLYFVTAWMRPIGLPLTSCM